MVSGFSGNASHDAFGGHNGEKFTTLERDNDRLSSGNCAALNGGGFWWWNCGYCRVNGASSTGGFYWSSLPGYLQLSRMWLQCK